MKIDSLLIPAGLICLLLAWLLPNHYFPWAAAYSEFTTAAALLLLVGAMAAASRDVPISSALIALVATIPAIQYATGQLIFLGDAVIASVYLAGLAISVAAGNVICSQRQTGSISVFDLLALMFVVGAVLSTWIALRQWLQFDGSLWFSDMKRGGRPFANLAQPNNLATLLALGLAATLYFFEKQRIHASAASTLAIFLLAGIVLTQSRTPWLMAVCVLAWWIWKSRTSARRLAPAILGCWIAVYAVMVACLPAAADALYLPSASLVERAQGLHRLDLWTQLGRAVLEGPLWGYGWNQVSLAQVAMSIDHPVRLFVEHSHNILLDIMLWNGPILGGAIILGASAWLLRLAWRARSTESILALLMVSLVLVHAMVELPLEYAYFLIPIGLLLGMVEADLGIAKPLSIPRWASLGALIGALVLLITLWVEYREIEEDHRLMRFESARIGLLKAEQKAPDVLLLSQLTEFLRYARTQASEGMTAEELQWMKQVAHRYPYPPSLFRYSLALALNGKPAPAAEQLQILKNLHGDERYMEGIEGLRLMTEKHPQLSAVFSYLPTDR